MSTATSTHSTTKTNIPSKSGPPDGLTAQLAYLTRVLKTPTIAACWEQLAEQAREANWSHEEYLAALLGRQVADREAAGTTMRIRTAHFPAVKTLEDFNLDHLPSLRRDILAHLATGTFIPKAENVILLGPEVINGLILGTESPGRRARCFDRCSVVSGVRAVRVLPVRGVRVLAGGRGSRRGPARARRAVPGALLGAAS